MSRYTWTMEIVKKTFWIFFILIIGYLLIASIFSTCYLGSVEFLIDIETLSTGISSEHTYYVRDYYVVHIAIFIATSAILMISKEKVSKERNSKAFRMILCLLVLLVGVTLVWVSQYEPRADQRHIMEIVSELQAGSFTSFMQGNYMYMYPFQIGIVLFYQILAVVMGGINPVGFQVINAVLIMISYLFLIHIGGILGKRYHFKSENGIAVLSLLFLPYLLYSTFIYGVVIGFMLAIISFYFVILFLDKRKKIYIFAGSLSMMLSIVVKTNNSIFLIAVLIILFADSLINWSEKKLRRANWLFILTAIICYGIGTFGMNAINHCISQGESGGGIPMMAYVVMGLQDSKAAPGWWNGYNWSLLELNNFNYELATNQISQDLVAVLQGFAQDIPAAITFFVKKISSQWNNPTFQSLWILDYRKGKGGLDFLFRPEWRNVFTNFVNLLQTWILSGSMIYAIARFKESTWKELLLPLTFIGGFLFHIIWEAKSMYAISYFLLLLPLSINGYLVWKLWLGAKKKQLLNGGMQSMELRKSLLGAGIAVCMVIVICLLSYSDFFVKLFARNDDTGVFNPYTQEMVNMDEGVINDILKEREQ